MKITFGKAWEKQEKFRVQPMESARSWFNHWQESVEALDSPVEVGRRHSPTVPYEKWKSMPVMPFKEGEEWIKENMKCRKCNRIVRSPWANKEICFFETIID